MYCYKWKEVINYITAEQYARDNGAIFSGNRCNAFWRGGKNPNVTFDDGGAVFCDHKEDVGGNVFKMVELHKGLDFTQATDYLGDLYCPHLKRENSDVNELGMKITDPPPRSALEAKIQDGYKEVARYEYKDESGTVKYISVRLENGDSKTFLQGVPSKTAYGGIKCGIPSGTNMLLYNLSGVMESQKIYLCEGEKCADFMVSRGYRGATTNSGGAKNFSDSLCKWLEKKDVVILLDNDDAGIARGAKLASMISRVARSVKFLTPSKEQKGDIVNYFESGATNADFDQLVLSTPFYYAPHPGDYTKEQIALAKKLNEEPLTNYIVVHDGKKERHEPKPLADIINEIYDRLLGAPFSLDGTLLFDHDKDTKKDKLIRNLSQLRAFIEMKTGKNVIFERKPGFSDMETVFAALCCQNQHTYKSISYVPHFPMRNNVFYTYPHFPEATKDHAAFWGFIDFFNPESAEDRALIAAMMMRVLYCDESAPGFIIGTHEGQGVGKSTLLQKIADVFSDGELSTKMDTSMKNIINSFSDILKRLVAPENGNIRILAIDNNTVGIVSPDLASFMTERDFSERPAYGNTSITRRNDVTVIVTANSNDFDSDAAQRFYILYIRKPVRSSAWERKVDDYIRAHRLEMIADMLDIMDHSAEVKVTGIDDSLRTRFPKFDETVLFPAAQYDAGMINKIYERIHQSQEDGNTDYEREDETIAALRDIIATAFNGNGILPDECVCAISASAIALKSSESGNRPKKLMKDIKELVGNCRIKCVKTNVFYPVNDTLDKNGNVIERKHRCVMWHGENRKSDYVHRIDVIDGKIKEVMSWA